MRTIDKIKSKMKELKANGDTYTPLPSGFYDATITSVEIRCTKSGNGTGMFLTFTTINPKRNIFHFENIENVNEKAAEIGLGKIAKLANACGLDEDLLDDLPELVNELAGCEVSILLDTKHDEGHDHKNIVKSYSPYGRQETSPIQAKKPTANNSMLPHGLQDVTAKQPTRPATKRVKPAIDVDQEFDSDIGF